MFEKQLKENYGINAENIIVVIIPVSLTLISQ